MKFFLAFSLVAVLGAQPTGREVMEMLDEQAEPKDVVSTTTMTLTKNVRGKERSRVRAITRSQKFYESGDFSSKTLIRFQKPADVKGTGLLMWEYSDADKDSDQWLYLPALQKSKRIISNQKNQSFMGSDFSYEDMEGRGIGEDSYKLLGEEGILDEPCYKVEAVPVETGTYARRIIWVEKRRSVMRKVEFYDKKDRLLKVMTIPEIRKDGDYWTILKMEMENVQKPHRTTLEVSDLSYDSGIEDSFFTERYLKRAR